MGRGKPRNLQVVNGQRVHFVAALSRIVLTGEPTPFVYEGPMIAALRAKLLLNGRGWTWRMADVAARGLVHEVLQKVGAKRPSWAEASTPHYAQADAFSLYERTRCRQCGLRLPETCRAFCTSRCRTTYHRALHRAEAAAFAAMAAEGL